VSTDARSHSNSWTNSEGAEHSIAAPGEGLGLASLTDNNHRTRELRNQAMALFAAVRT
jgi:hypothetical protein